MRLPTSSMWQERLDVDLRALEQRVAAPFNLPVLQALFVVVRTVVTYADRYDVILADAVGGFPVAETTKGVVDLARENLGQAATQLRAIGGRCLEPFPPGFLPEPSTEDATVLIATESVSSRGSINNLIERSAAQRSNGLIDVATAGGIKRDKRPERLARDALYVVGGESHTTDLQLYPYYVWANPDVARHPGWSRWTKESRSSQFPVEKDLAHLDVAAVARYDQDVQEVITTFAELLGIERPDSS